MPARAWNGSAVILAVLGLTGAWPVHRVVAQQDAVGSPVSLGEIQDAIVRVPLPEAISATGVLERSTDTVHGEGVRAKYEHAARWARFTAMEEVEGVGSLATRVIYDDGHQRVVYSIVDNSAIITPGLISDVAPLGASFQASPICWIPMLERIASGGIEAEAVREGDVLALVTGAYSVRIHEPSGEITRADIQSGPVAFRVDYLDWQPIGSSSEHRHPTRITLTSAVSGRDDITREYRITDVAVMDPSAESVAPSFTAQTVVRNTLTNTAYMANGTPVEIPKTPGDGLRSRILHPAWVAGVGTGLLLLAGVVAIRRRGGGAA